ncbi:MAG: phosphotransferase [Chloroflexi bacterium]|nr:phosphotransferase [Chloroflexota bacterium]
MIGIATGPLPVRAEALRWATQQLQGKAELVGVRALTGGRSHSNHVLAFQTPSGRLRVVLRRWTRVGWQDDDPDFTAEREASVLLRLEAAGVPAPRLIGVDPSGLAVGVPAILETFVAGRRLVRPVAPISFAERLAIPIGIVQAVPIGRAPSSEAYAYRRFHPVGTLAPPGWARDVTAWNHAIQVVQGSMPPARTVFIHRDYHPGNVLWVTSTAGWAVSGLVDWTGASAGPAPIDVGHMRFNLAASYGPALADAFLDEARRAGVADDFGPEWDLWTALDVVPDIDPDEESAAALARIERHVVTALSAVGA